MREDHILVNHSLYFLQIQLNFHHYLMRFNLFRNMNGKVTAKVY